MQNTVDFNSFIDYIILSELSKNADAYRLSTFLHKDNDAIDGRLSQRRGTINLPGFIR
jgi:hypothetical protein